MNFQQIADQWLYETLDTAVTVPVYNTVIPQGETGTVVVFQLIDSSDMVVNAQIRKGSTKQYMVKVVGREHDATTIASTYDLVDTALHRARTTVLYEGVQVGCWRTGEISYIEPSKPGVWLHYGGEYNLDVLD